VPVPVPVATVPLPPGRRGRVAAVSRRCLPQVQLLGPLLVLILLVLWSFSPWRPGSSSQRDAILFAGGGAVMLGWSVVVLWQVPKRQARVKGGAEVDPKELFKIENDARNTLAQILVGLFGLIGFAFTWLQLAESRDATGKTLRITQDGQIAGRFAQAVDQIGDDSLDVQLGGFYQLERIADDAPDAYHQAVLDVLAGYVRGHAAQGTAVGSRAEEATVGPDVQAVLRILSREPLVATAPTTADDGTPTAAAPERRSLNLRGADLRELEMDNLNLTGADLRSAKLAGAALLDAILHDVDLSGADLSGADLIRADLSGALLFGADLEGAFLRSADLTEARLDTAILDGANLGNAVLTDASLEGAFLGAATLGQATLTGAVLRRADLSGATMTLARLDGADLREADLSTANLTTADLTGALLAGADLSGANLVETRGLTQAMLDGACAERAPLLTTGLAPPPIPADGSCGDGLPGAQPASTAKAAPGQDDAPMSDPPPLDGGQGEAVGDDAGMAGAAPSDAAADGAAEGGGAAVETAAGDAGPDAAAPAPAPPPFDPGAMFAPATAPAPAPAADPSS